VKNLTKEQRVVFAEFLGNFAVAWLAAGLIAPFVTKEELGKVIQQSLIPVMLATVLLITMLYLTKGRMKK